MTRSAILIVEDEAVVARDIERQLLDLGYEPVGIAATGEEAITLAGTLLPRLILMDIHLGGAIDGIEAAIAIRAQFEIPSVFLTAYATDDVVKRARRAEPLGYILKPFEEQSLRTTLEVALFKDDIDRRLRTSETQYRAVVESAHDAVITADGAGLVVGWSASAVALFGYTEAEVVGQPLALVMPGFSHDVDGTDTSETPAIERPSADWKIWELEGRRKDGREVPVEVSIATWATREGAFVTAMVRDITERRRSQSVFRLQSAALNAAANAVIITDLKGTILWSNRAFTTLTGYRPDEATGHNPRDLVKSGVHDAAFFKEMWDTILGGHVWHGEMTNRRKDGSLYVEEQTITPVTDERGRLTNFVAVKKDLTDQRQLQAQFLHAQKMEAIGQLAAGVAHDFNNLLTAILGYGEFLLQDLPPGGQRDDVGEIVKAGHRAAALTEQLLAFSRKQVLQTSLVNVNAVATDVTSMLRRVIRENIELTTTLAPGLALVRADAAQIVQVLMNLAVNARDAMPQGGRLTIATAGLEIDDASSLLDGPVRPGRYVRLTVTDTGTGMTEETSRRALDPFFTTKEPGKGTGLGLSTVYGIVKQSEGYLWIDSQLGRGTTVTTLLPAATGETAAVDPVAPVSELTFGSETVLLVEDEETLRLLAQRTLERAGHRVVATRHAAEAEMVFEERQIPVDILVTDVVMPGRTGIELYQRLVAIQPGLRAVFISGYTDPAIVDQALLMPNTSFLRKPFTAEALLRSIAEGRARS